MSQALFGFSLTKLKEKTSHNALSVNTKLSNTTGMQSHIKRRHGRYTKVDTAKVLDELHKIRDARFCVYFFEKSQLKCETLFLKKLETPVTAAVIKSES